jgi:hypothetical protein
VSSWDDAGPPASSSLLGVRWAASPPGDHALGRLAQALVEVSAVGIAIVGQGHETSIGNRLTCVLGKAYRYRDCVASWHSDPAKRCHKVYQPKRLMVNSPTDALPSLANGL